MVIESMDNETHPLRAWRKSIEPGTLEAAADRLGVKAPMLSRWETGMRAIPPHRVLGIERVTGISRSTLRPDLYPVEQTEAAQ